MIFFRNRSSIERISNLNLFLGNFVSNHFSSCFAKILSSVSPVTFESVSTCWEELFPDGYFVDLEIFWKRSFSFEIAWFGKNEVHVSEFLESFLGAIHFRKWITVFESLSHFPESSTDWINEVWKSLHIKFPKSSKTLAHIYCSSLQINMAFLHVSLNNGLLIETETSN